MDVFSLVTSLTLKTDDYDKGLDDAKKGFNGFMDNMAKAGSTLSGWGSTLTNAITKPVMQGIAQTAELADEIDKGSQKLGISAQAYQEWDAVLQHSGSSISALTPAMKALDSAVDKGSDAFGALGLSLDDVAGMSNENLFAGVITALQNITDENERASLASDLLGRSYMELAPLLNTSAEDTQAMKQRLHELGGVLSDEAVASGAAYQDSLQDLNTSFNSITTTVTASLLPAITRIMDFATGLIEKFSALDGGTQDLILTLGGMAIAAGPVSSALGGVISLITTLPNLISTVKTAATALFTALSANPIGIVAAAVAALITVLATLWNTNDDFREAVTAAWEKIKEVATAVFGAVKNVVENVMGAVRSTVGERLSNIKTAFEENGGGIKGVVSAGWEAIKGYYTAGFDILDKLTGGKLSELADLFTNSFENLTDSALSWGKNVVLGFWDGITAMATWINEKVTGFFSSVVDSVERFLGIRSPSKLFREQIGRNIALGVAEGIEDKSDAAVKAADDMAKDVYDKSAAWLDKQVKYHNYSLQEQLEVWETIQGQFISESKQYADAEEKIFGLKYQIQQEYLSKVEGINKNLESLEENYQKQLESRTQQIFNSYRLFDQIPERQEANGEALIGNLRGQISTIEEFYSGLQELADRGVGDALVEDIRAMGPSAVDQLSALLALSEDKLDEYAALYAEKQELANSVAVKELAGLREETDRQLQENMDSLSEIFGSVVEQSEGWGTDLMQNFIDGIESMKERLASAVSGVAQSVKDFLGFSEPKEGPLSNFHTYAPDMMALFAKGIRDNEKLVTDQIDKSFDFGTRTIDFAASGVGRVAAGGGYSAGGYAAPELPNLVFETSGDIDQIVRLLHPRLRWEDRRIGPSMVSGVF